MTDYAPLEGFTAEWVQPKTLKRHFELRIGEALAGTLAFRSSLGTFARAEGASGCWTYKSVGFLNARITIRAEGNETDEAVYKPSLLGYGTLVFRDGATYTWRSSGFWRTTWVFTDATKQPMIRFSPGLQERKLRDIGKSQATVLLEGHAPRGDRRFILLSFGMYLLTVDEDDDTAVLTGAIG